MSAQFDLLILRVALQNLYALNVKRFGYSAKVPVRIAREIRRINNQILNLGRVS